MEELKGIGIEKNATHWIVPVSRWSSWEPEENADASPMPNVAFIEPALRRRLSLFTRMALKVAHDCAGDLSGVRIIFASRHGDLTRTTSMLVDLANKEILSPTAFSMSVLNACTGIYSIAKKVPAPSTAIASGESTFGYGLLEACLQLASHPDTPVLFVYADEPAPAVYGLRENDLHKPLAIGLLLNSKVTSPIVCETNEFVGGEDTVSQPHAFLECLKNKETAVWIGENKSWKWSWHEQAH